MMEELAQTSICLIFLAPFVVPLLAVMLEERDTWKPSEWGAGRKAIDIFWLVIRFVAYFVVTLIVADYLAVYVCSQYPACRF